MTNDYAQAGGNLLVGLLSGFMEGRERERERKAGLAEERRKEEAMIRRTKIARGWVPETMITPAPAVEPTTLESMLLEEPVTLGRGVAGVPVTEERLRPPEKSLADVVKDIQARMKTKAWADYQAGKATPEQKKLIGVLITPRKVGVTPEEKRKIDYRKWMAKVAEETGITELTLATLEKMETLSAEQAWANYYADEPNLIARGEADTVKSGLIRLFGARGKKVVLEEEKVEEDLPTLMERIISGLVPGQYKRR